MRSTSWSRKASGRAAETTTGTPGFDATRVKVSTAHRVVYLMGILRPGEDEIASELARNVPGVERVVKIFEYRGD